MQNIITSVVKSTPIFTVTGHSVNQDLCYVIQRIIQHVLSLNIVGNCWHDYHAKPRINTLKLDQLPGMLAMYYLVIHCMLIHRMIYL